MSIVLAFDIERSGALNTHDTLAIGASVVNTNFKELDNLFLPAYFPDETIFELRCLNEFWSKNTAILDQLKYDGPLTKTEREKEIIGLFQDFRRKWEQYATDNNLTLEIVSDNNIYDGGFINELIQTYTNDFPLPYSATKYDNGNQKYQPFWEVHAQQRGLLMSVDPAFKGDWGLSRRINELYDVPEMIKSHDHLPHNDAYTIAFEQQILLGIRDGKIKRRT